MRGIMKAKGANFERELLWSSPDITVARSSITLEKSIWDFDYILIEYKGWYNKKDHTTRLIPMKLDSGYNRYMSMFDTCIYYMNDPDCGTYGKITIDASGNISSDPTTLKFEYVYGISGVNKKYKLTPYKIYGIKGKMSFTETE